MAPRKDTFTYTKGYFNGIPALKQEWKERAERAKEEDPPNLRKSMLVLQAGAWKTSAITSDGTLIDWINKREDDRAVSSSATATDPVRNVLSGYFLHADLQRHLHINPLL